MGPAAQAVPPPGKSSGIFILHSFPWPGPDPRETAGTKAALKESAFCSEGAADGRDILGWAAREASASGLGPNLEAGGQTLGRAGQRGQTMLSPRQMCACRGGGVGPAAVPRGRWVPGMGRRGLGQAGADHRAPGSQGELVALTSGGLGTLGVQEGCVYSEHRDRAGSREVARLSPRGGDVERKLGSRVCKTSDRACSGQGRGTEKGAGQTGCGLRGRGAGLSSPLTGCAAQPGRPFEAGELKHP